VFILSDFVLHPDVELRALYTWFSLLLSLYELRC